MFCKVLIHSCPVATPISPSTTPQLLSYMHREVEICHLEISNISINCREIIQYLIYLFILATTNYFTLTQQKRNMVLLDHLWNDVVAGPQPERGLKHLKRVFTTPLSVKNVGESSGKFQGSLSMLGTPVTPGTPTSLSPNAVKRENVWRSVFNPESNLATKGIGSNIFDKPQPNSPVWMYSGETRSKHC